MPVFDFSEKANEKGEAICTYVTFASEEHEASAEKPIMVIDNKSGELKHHTSGMFINPIKRTAFEFQGENANFRLI